MFCKNCGNELNENAVACLKCGCNPKKGDKNCPSCGVETSPNQIVCIKCGVSLKSQSFPIDTSGLDNFDTDALLKNKEVIFAFLALIGYFLPWISEDGFSISGSGIQKISDLIPIGGLLSLLFLFPLCLIGVIVGNFIPQLSKFKKLLSIGSIALVGFALIAIILYMNDLGYFELGIIGFGLYVSLIGSILSAYYGSKKG